MNVTTTIEADIEEFVDDTDNRYPIKRVDSLHSKNDNLDIDDEESVLKDSDNELVKWEYYSVF